jgi:hypothetical protein
MKNTSKIPPNVGTKMFFIKNIQHSSKIKGPNEKEKKFHSSIHPFFLPSFLPSLRSLKIKGEKGHVNEVK